MAKIDANKINDQYTDIWSRCRQSPPVPTPAPSDVKDQCSRRQLRQKTINLSIHNRDRVVPGNADKIIVVMLGSHAFAEFPLHCLLSGRVNNAVMPYTIGTSAKLQIITRQKRAKPFVAKHQ